MAEELKSASAGPGETCKKIELQVWSHERIPDEDIVLQAARAADRRLIFVPMLFIICRMWGTIRFLLFATKALPSDHPPLVHKIMLSLQAVGDTSQAFANCILFCFCTAKVFNHLKESFIQMCCCCCPRNEKSRYLHRSRSPYEVVRAIDSTTEMVQSSEGTRERPKSDNETSFLLHRDRDREYTPTYGARGPIHSHKSSDSWSFYTM